MTKTSRIRTLLHAVPAPYRNPAHKLIRTGECSPQLERFLESHPEALNAVARAVDLRGQLVREAFLESLEQERTRIRQNG